MWKLWNFKFLALLLVVSAFTATSVPSNAQEVTPPAADETLIYVIREGRFIGAANGYWIGLNNETVARVRNKKHAIIRAKAGILTLNLANFGVSVAAAAIDDRHGETVYLKWRLGDTEITELSEAKARKMLRKSKRMDPIDAPLPNAEQISALVNMSRYGFDLMRPAAEEQIPDEERAVITIFRRGDADKLDFGIWGESGFVGTLSANEAVNVIVPAGNHFFLAGNVGTTLMQAQVEAGKRYYAWLDYGVMLGRVRLTPVTKQESAKLDRWLKKVKQVELSPDAITIGVRGREEIVSEFIRGAAERANAGEADFNLLGSEHAY